ncbi:hypothetical protein HK101_006732 [Irineochytrium annulatum]|nr:hypothetical protein HK101_006732 [Irineochytrium annulatum]
MVRTTINPCTYMVLAGDAAHAFCLYHPCPPAGELDVRCDFGRFNERYETEGEDLPYSMHADEKVAANTVARLSRMDALPNVMVCAAHETELEGVVDLFPKGCANEWKAKGWKERKAAASKVGTTRAA